MTTPQETRCVGCRTLHRTHHELLKPISGDMELAKSFMAEAGYT